MNKAYLLTGGNMGNRVANLAQARELLQSRAGHIMAASSLYETSAWGNVPQPDFLNQVLLCETPLAAAELLTVIMEIEQEMGRYRQQKNGPRVIDIDILFFNDEIIRTDALTIPHPRLHLRNFTLEPMHEIAPHLVHPVLGKTVARLLEESPDTLDVKKYSMKSSGS